jgi:hypothetical protein
MMGRKYREQANFFYEFRLDDMIPKGHLTPWLSKQDSNQSMHYMPFAGECDGVPSNVV